MTSIPASPTDPPRIRGVAFDLDGLLVNTEELYQHVGAELLARRGRVDRKSTRLNSITL